jgi:hypothetical protein
MNQVFRNGSTLTFTDISSEEWREYVFPDGSVVRIVAPLKVHASSSNSHRVFDAAGISHYIPKGWFHLRWMAKVGHPHFEF